MRSLLTSSPEFWDSLKALLARDLTTDKQIIRTVESIVAEVKQRGDAALCEYTEKFDQFSVASADAFEVCPNRIQYSLESISDERRQALTIAAERVRTYSEKQRLESWQYTEADGTVLGQQVTALDRVGLYVPGGKAAYPSSVLMNAIPAKVAGVKELIMVVPTPKGEINDMVFAAAAIAGVDRVFTLGGAQAIAALAYGTETVPAVDKIVGPGNAYVAVAKRQVFGTVGIDMIAGPSEILVVCDGQTDPDWIALDLFSQAEHDEAAQSILVSWDEDFLYQVKASIDRLIKTQPRADIIEKSLSQHGAFIQVKDQQEALEVINYIAPEHLELSMEEPEVMAKQVRHAGAIFLGRHTPEALGDYCAGPSHVLPTSRTARFSSPLGVYDFQKRTSLIGCSPEGAKTLGKVAVTLAISEGLIAHAESAKRRVSSDSP